MKSKFAVCCSLLLLCSVALPATVLAIPAFPDAEGYGEETVGGRGGTVYKVTHGGDSGEGSFRAACEASGRRYVVFDFTGIINLENDLNIFNPNITIAGETSPGGVLITGRKVLVNTQQVIMRHMRFRVGSHRIQDGADSGTLDSISFWGDGWGGNAGSDIIMDHCSVSWGIDENMSITGGVTNMTVSWCIFSEGLTGYVGSGNGHNGCAYLHSDCKDHSKGMMVSGKPSNDPFPNTVSLHHNYIAHNTDRSPLIYSPVEVSTTVDVVNNVVYNFKGGLAMQTEGYPNVNWVNNYVKPGPDSHPWARQVILDVEDSGVMRPLLYLSGNIGSSTHDQSDTHWCVGNSYYNEDIPVGWMRATPYSVPEIATTTMSYAYAVEILSDVGATKPIRDSVDQRVVADFSAAPEDSGTIIDNVTFPDDFPQFNTALEAPADTDDDGMADAWETSEFGDLSQPAAGDHDQDGYDNIEEYFHYLSGTVSSGDPDPDPDPDPNPDPNPDTPSNNSGSSGSGCFASTLLE